MAPRATAWHGRHWARLAASAAGLALALAAPLARGQGAGAPPTVVVEGGTQVVHAPEPSPIADQSETPGSVVRITREQFQPGDATVADVLERVPGVLVTQGGDRAAPAKITLRGSRTDQVLVIVDGVPLNTETDNPAQGRLTGRQGVDLSTVDLANVQSIEIVRGAASSLYGPGAAAGAIIIRTRRSRQREALVSHTEGTGGYSESGLRYTEPLEGSALTFTARNVFSQGEFIYFSPTATQAQASAASPNPCSEDLGGGYQLRKCNQVQDTQVGAAWLRGERQRWALDYESYLRRGLGSIQDPQPFGRDERTRTSASYADGLRVSPQQDLSWQVHASQVLGRQTQNNTLGSGVLENHHTEEGRSAELRWEPSQGENQWRVTGGLSQLVIRDEFFTHARDQGFAAGRWLRELGSAKLEADLRTDTYSDVAGQGTYRAAATAPLAGGWGLKASTGTGYRPPSLYELYDPGSIPGTSAANPGLKPESSTSADAGLYFSRSAAIYAEALYFEQDYQDEIVALANPASPSLFQFQNLSHTRSAGVEASLAFQPLAALSCNLSLTQTHALLLNNDAIDPRDNGNQVPGVPVVQAQAQVTWHRERWNATVKTRYASERFVDTANSRFLQPYQIWDLAWGFPLPWHLNGLLEARNVTNETYSEVDNFPSPGRQFFLTVRWHFASGFPTEPGSGTQPPIPAQAQPPVPPQTQPPAPPRAQPQS